ncbi:MAG TPA: hypothetical protein VFB33_08695 [Candidatus Binataceae bacterium]|nr:hypothetical protein [Candidatus Binataceae bacterium]
MDRATSLADQFARLRGVSLTRWCEQGASPLAPSTALITIGASHLPVLHVDEKRRLARLVSEGAVLYVRGLPRNAASLDLAPFAHGCVRVAGERRAVGYRFTTGAIVPAVLMNEETTGAFEAAGAELEGFPVQPLMTVRHVDGVERAGIFMLECGRGCVIYDLHPEEEDAGSQSGVALLMRLVRPDTRHHAVGTLFAADRAAGRDVKRPPAFNLVIDDRPTNFDHFNTAPLGDLLRRVEALCPGAHTDFAWTPSYTHVPRAYIETLRSFDTGFVWHGLYRHVDHRKIPDLADDFARGRRLVGRIEERFHVRLQPVMVFPFEGSTSEQLQFLSRAGFTASVEEPRQAGDLPCGVSAASRACVQPAQLGGPGIVVLHRYQASELSRDRMLAMATLGVPIIAYAHPWNLGLRRLSRLRPFRGDVAYFDEVLKFAASKRLRPLPLAEIAREARASDARGFFADASLAESA